MPNDDLQIITFPDTAGQKHNYNILSRFNYNAIDYIVLAPCEDENGEIELYRYTSDDGVNIEITEILSEEEFDSAIEYLRSGENEIITVNIPNKDGKQIECQIVRIFTYARHDTIALMPLEKNDGGMLNIHLYWYIISDIDENNIGIALREIPEDKYELVRQYFLNMIDNI